MRTPICFFPQAAKCVDIKAGLQASLLAMFDAAMWKAWPLAKGAGVTSSNVIKCPNYKYGDFQCNAAMSLYKTLKVSGNASRVAEFACSFHADVHTYEPFYCKAEFCGRAAYVLHCRFCLRMCGLLYAVVSNLCTGVVRLFSHGAMGQRRRS